MKPRKGHSLPKHVQGRLAKARSEYTARGNVSRMVRTQSDAVLYMRDRYSPRYLFLRAAKSLRSLAPSTKRKVAAVFQFFCLVAMAALLLSMFSYMFPGEEQMLKMSRSRLVRDQIQSIMKGLRAVHMSPKPSIVRKRKQKKKKYVPPRKLGVLKRLSATFVMHREKPEGHMERISMGSFKDVRRIGVWKVAVLPPEANRFDVPWILWDRVETASLKKSGYRVLFSTIKVKSSTGLGHGMTILNAELSTALNLGLSYTHRVGIYGSLSREIATTVENIFGWGVGEVPRRFIEKEVCLVKYVSNKNPPAVGVDRCTVCSEIRNNAALPLRNIVEIPASLSYGCLSCQSKQVAVQGFLKRYSKNFTLFQMSPKKCDQSPKSPDFLLSYRYFYWKYWDAHGNKSFGTLPSTQMKLEGRQWSVPFQKRGSIRFRQDEIIIAIHARRGDFLFERRRRMISGRAFKNVVKEVKWAIDKVGGVFAEMPIRVIIYSEGRRSESDGDLHDVRQMDREFVDTDGQVRDARWFHRLLVPGKPYVRGSKMYSELEYSVAFGSGVRVEFRISTDVEEAVHEMGSADVFVGSASDFSQYAVRMISRAGIQLLPEYIGGNEGCCLVRFHDRSGGVARPKRLVEFWRLYVMANEKSAERAIRDAEI